MVRRGLPGRAHAAARAPIERCAFHARGAGPGGVRHRHRSVQRTDSATRSSGRASRPARGADRPVVEPRLGSAAIPGAVCGAIRRRVGRLRPARLCETWLHPARAALAPSEGAGVDRLAAGGQLPQALAHLEEQMIRVEGTPATKVGMSALRNDSRPARTGKTSASGSAGAASWLLGTAPALVPCSPLPSPFRKWSGP
jgi:hypothetical protein